MNFFNDTAWARCPCGWGWEGNENGRGTKELAKRLHAKKCEVFAYCLAHPELAIQNVSTYQGGAHDAHSAGMINMGENMNGNGTPIADLGATLDAMTTALGGEIPTTDTTSQAREKKARENRKKRLAKKRAKAKKDEEKRQEEAKKRAGGGKND